MRRAQLIKEAAEISVGGSEDEAKERVKQLFKKDISLDPYKDLSAEEIAQLEEEHEQWKIWEQKKD